MRTGTFSGACSLLLAGAMLLGVSQAVQAEPLKPQTRIRLTVVQWMPTVGEYKVWPGIGGEFVVSRDGTLQLPAIGSLDVSRLDSDALAGEITARLQKNMGLVERPDANVEIVEYPPVYVVGDVATPGEYRFRNGITALQVLAVSGGPYRAAGRQEDDQIRLVGELRSVANEIVRTRTRISRLNAEMAGEEEIGAVAQPVDDADAGLADEVLAQEKIIFATRNNERERQSKSLRELRDLLDAEIKVLEEKIRTSDLGIKNVQEQLQSVTVLVEKGIAVASRRSELELALAGFQTNRLDQVTAIMRARQNITEATRSLEGLQDRHKTEVAGQLQEEQARLEQLLLRQATSQKLLLTALADQATPTRDRTVTYSVTRNVGGQVSEIPAEEATLLEPGDVVKVVVDPGKAAPRPADAPEKVSQADLAPVRR